MGFAGVLKKSFAALGGYDLWMTRVQFPGVLVLCYHGLRTRDLPAGAMPFEGLHVFGDEFREHCRFLKKNCDPLSIKVWQEILEGNRARPDRPVLITFDDGYRSVLKVGLPILEEFQLPGVVFVCTEPTRRQSLYWFDEMARREGEQAVDAAKQMSYSEWASHAVFDRPALPGDPCAPMTVAELQELARSPWIEVGAHTSRHPILAKCPPDVQREEIRASRTFLEGALGKRVVTFAYPNGRPGLDYNQETLELLKADGFQLAFTTEPRFARGAKDSFELSRFIMLAGLGAGELGHRCCRSWPR